MEGRGPQPPRFPFGGGGAGEAPPPQAHMLPQFQLFPPNFTPNPFVNNPNPQLHPQNPNFFIPNALPFHLPAVPFQNPSFHGQNPGFLPHHSPSFRPPQNPSVDGQIHSQQPNNNRNLGFPQAWQKVGVTIERLSEEIMKARRGIIAGGDYVSAWKVLQAVLLALRLDSWESLGYQMQQVPALHSLILTEGKINAFIQCFVGVRSITTLYELESAICENEGVEQFEELELGPFLRHPLVMHYFSVSSDLKEVSKITSENILSGIYKFLSSYQDKESKIDEQLDFIVQKSLTSTEKLNVRIQSLGKHISYIRKASQSENATLKKYVDGLKKKFGLKVRKRPLLSLDKRQLDDRFNDMSRRVDSFTSASTQFCGKHKRFSSSSDDDDGDTTDSEDNSPNAQSNSKASPNSKIPDRVSNCPYPSAVEEMMRLKFTPDNCDSQGSTDDDDGESTEHEDIEGGNNAQSKYKSLQNMKLSDRSSKCPYPSATEESLRLQFISEKDNCGNTDSHVEDGTDNEDNTPGNNAQRSSKTPRNAKLSGQVSNSLFQSAAEEMSRLPPKPEKCVRDRSTGASRQEKIKNELPSKKRKLGDRIVSVSTPPKIPKRHQGKMKAYTALESKELFNQNTSDPLLSESTRMFLATWRETCCNYSAEEVVEKMLRHTRWKRKGKLELKAFLFSYPFAGLLDLAMKSIKSGIWDSSMYDAFRNLGYQGTANLVPRNQTSCASMEIESDEDDEDVSAKMSSTKKHGVKVDDIIKKILAYFEMEDDGLSCGNSNTENRVSFLRKLCSCESWLTAEFSVEEFQCFGYGDLMTFLEKYMHLLPKVLQKCLVGVDFEEHPFEASMLQLQLEVLLSQASTGVWKNHRINKRMMSGLLRKQFPSVCFRPVESDSLVNFGNAVRGNEENACSKTLLFSATLLKGFEDLAASGDKSFIDTAGFEVNKDYTEGSLGSYTTTDAIELLTKAPMLIDLYSWSHWDLVYAPSLGPLVVWLLNEVNTKDLLVLVCKGGKIIRLDNSATIDSFLEVMIEGSPFQTAVKLLSLLALYGGELDAPVSLLKSHAQKGLQGLIHSLGKTESGDYDDFNPLGRLTSGRNVSDKCATLDSSNSLLRDKSRTNKGLAVASRFILDCLGYLPGEFWTFAAHILLTGFQAFVKDAPSVILSECKRLEERVLLHDVGYSLGIVEWINDYHSFVSSEWTSALPCSECSISTRTRVLENEFEFGQDARKDCPASKFCESVPIKEGNDKCGEIRRVENIDGVTRHTSSHGSSSPTNIIEAIRRDEFGLDSGLSVTDSNMLKKQHARLGRALHCLSHELYSQDSHFLLELVQNADDNMYPQNIEPTLVFILQDKGIVVLNNELGFSAENIKSICDIGNSTKRESDAGYIGKKGIGFKSVFRVTDAPEIHSNGFHIKFDITQGQIGFVLPTAVPPCDIGMFNRLASTDFDQLNYNSWRTCIVLPFKAKSSSSFSLSNIMSMFSDLHPSLLLFLHRLKCIKFRNMFNDSVIVMKKEVGMDGIIKISHGTEQMFWLVVSNKLQANSIRPNTKNTEISVAFTLEETSDRGYIPHLSQQPVFAFLPLRTYGLKFIVQGDFILPSSREEVDGDSPWNQWLLSEIPSLFVAAEKSFCKLPCFSKNLGRAVTAFMSFVPLIGEVHGFFSSLPRMIISKLRMSDCLLLEGDQEEWVPPCKVLRNWNEEARNLLPDKLLREHIGVGFLNKDIVLPDSLARALGVEEYGPKTLVSILLSLSRSRSGFEQMGLHWLSAWINSIYLMRNSMNESDLISNLKKIPFIPLSDGKYGSVEEGTIWLRTDVSGADEYQLKGFSKVYAKLRTVSVELFSAAAVSAVDHGTLIRENITRMLLKLGVQLLSAHEIVKVHILPTISCVNSTPRPDDIMVEYLGFIMLHLESGCSKCHEEEEHIIGQMKSKVSVLTNFGYKRFNEEPIHFSKEFGNPIDVKKLTSGTDVKWNEIDNIYLRHPAIQSIPDGVMKWRRFFKLLGVTDFVQIINTEKRIGDVSKDVLRDLLLSGNMISMEETASDWESPELVNLLSTLSSEADHEKCKHMLEILDLLWDDCFSNKEIGYFKISPASDGKPFKSSLVSTLQSIQWMMSTIDNNVHFSKNIFHDCEAVSSILGSTAPYAVHKVRSQKLLDALGLKCQVMLDDILAIFRSWRKMGSSLKGSTSQMSKLYTIISTEMATSKQKIVEELSSGPYIFVPSSFTPYGDVVSGCLFSPREVYWHDMTGALDQIKLLDPKSISRKSHLPFTRILHNLYPNLQNFFVNECGVHESPPFTVYLQILLHLSNVALPSQAAMTVFHVLLKWADGLLCGSLRDDDVEHLRESLSKKEYAVLPTGLDKWVSLHPSFGLICWSDDDSLRVQFKDLEGIDFLYFGDITDVDRKLLQNKMASLYRRLKIPAISEVVSREAIYYGPTDSSFKASLVSWALPYAQRYMYYFHMDKYNKLKQAGFENLRELKIVVVEKLFYRNVIKCSQVASKKRFECNCLLEGNTFYATREADSHSVFMELSHLLFGEAPELHLANFLHMITTMAEAGSTEEQMEFFIINSQKLPKLPKEEHIWSLSSNRPQTSNSPVNNSDTMLSEQPNMSKLEEGPGIGANCSVDWTTPRFNFSSYQPNTQASGSLQTRNSDATAITDVQKGHVAEIQMIENWNFEKGQALCSAVVYTSKDTENSNHHSDNADNVVTLNSGMVADPENLVPSPAFPRSGRHASDSSARGKQTYQTNPQAMLTGRLGEFVAFKYFVGRFGEANVRWVNETNESGLPYDIIVGKEEGSQEYVEVKATKSASKNWFNLSFREWQFAVEKGECFSIAHVVLLANSTSKVTVYKNLAKLSQLNKLRLAILIQDAWAPTG